MIARFLLLLIRGYQRLWSPLWPAACRFHPTCSQYAYESIERFGWRAGLWRALKRLLKCHPLHPGGFDPVVPE